MVARGAMIDIEIHGTAGRTRESREALLRATRAALADVAYAETLTLVDTGSNVFSVREVQTMPFARIYAPADVLASTIDDVRERLAHLFETLEGVQVVRVNTRDAG
jgi:hypothetical protein